MNDNSNGSAGHRKRLRSRFARSGLEGMQDYEAIELLLTYSIPRKDVKPIAKLLLERFGNISGVLNAPSVELLNIPGIGESTVILFRLSKALVLRSLEEKLRMKNSIDSPQDVCDFLKLKIGCGKKETLMILYLNACRQLIRYDICQGTVDHATVYAREITERALICNACFVILAHNHPSGSCTPSKEDILLTRNLTDTLHRLGIKLLDHILVTPFEIKSMIFNEETGDAPVLYAVSDNA